MGGLLALIAAITLVSCGGGGAATAPNNPGAALTLLPSLPTVYAGVPVTFTVTGGRPPYKLSVNEAILVIPETTNGSFVAVPVNPGVIDAGLQPGELPVRSINLSAQDQNGTIVTMVVKVAQNFLTGYGAVFTPITCPVKGASGAQACAGGETTVVFNATNNGALHGNQAFRLTAVRGNFLFKQPDGTFAATLNVMSDHEGKVIAIFNTPAGSPTQIGVIRITEVATGVNTDTAFTIAGAEQAALLAVPDTLTFTGRLTTDCGQGTGNFLVFDGVPPYTISNPNPTEVVVTPNQSSTNPGSFSVQVNARVQPPCLGPVPIVVTDSRGVRTTVTVSSVAGTATPPAPTPVVVTPNSITLLCGTSGSVAVTGGTGAYQAVSTHPRIVPVVSGNILTVTRLLNDAPVSYANTGVVSVTDGNSTGTLTVTVTGGTGGTGTQCGATPG